MIGRKLRESVKSIDELHTNDINTDYSNNEYGDDTFSDMMTMITVMKRKQKQGYAWKELLSFGPQLGL